MGYQFKRRFNTPNITGLLCWSKAVANDTSACTECEHPRSTQNTDAELRAATWQLCTSLSRTNTRLQGTPTAVQTPQPAIMSARQSSLKRLLQFTAHVERAMPRLLGR